MNINEPGGGIPNRILPGPHFKPVESNVDGKAKNGEVAGSQSNGENGVQRVRDPQVVKLVNQLEDNSEIRADRIKQVTEKLKQGEYFTRQTAEDVASSILDQI